MLEVRYNIVAVWNRQRNARKLLRCLELHAGSKIHGLRITSKFSRNYFRILIHSIVRLGDDCSSTWLASPTWQTPSQLDTPSLYLTYNLPASNAENLALDRTSWRTDATASQSMSNST